MKIIFEVADDGKTIETLLKHVKPQQVTIIHDNKKDVANPKAEFKKLLRKIGITSDLKGYDYIYDAVKLAQQDQEYLHSVTKLLYPQIAKMHNDLVCATQMAIRHAISRSESRSTHRVYCEVFGTTLRSARTGRITTKYFLAALVDYCNVHNWDLTKED